MKKIASLLLMIAGSIASIACLILFFDLSKHAMIDVMNYLTVSVTVLLIGLHLKLNLLNKEYFYYYIFPIYVFLIGIDIHNYYTGETGFNEIFMGTIPNTFMIAGCIVGFILNKYINKTKPSPDSARQA
jgi:hypothetical protein